MSSTKVVSSRVACMIRLERWSKVGTSRTVRSCQDGEKAFSNERRTDLRPALFPGAAVDGATDADAEAVGERSVAPLASSARTLHRAHAHVADLKALVLELRAHEPFAARVHRVVARIAELARAGNDARRVAMGADDGAYAAVF